MSFESTNFYGKGKNMRSMKSTLVGLAMVMLVGAAALAQDKPAAPAATAASEPKPGVSMTVYNGGYGVVREVRNLDIKEGTDTKFTDVAQQIDATTVHFKSITDPAAKLLEQNYQYDLVSADKLLQKYIDKSIEVVCKDKNYSGKLMSFDGNQIVLQEEKGSLVMVQRADNVRDIRFSALPEGLLTQPTLLWKVASAKGGNQLCEVTYQTGGIGWHAEYVLVLKDNDTAADLSGWVSVQNNSGKTYKDAMLKFIAGDVRKIVEQQPRMAYAKSARGGGEAFDAAPMEEKAFFEYHMYSLPRPSTVADNEIKQLEMFTPVSGLKVQKLYMYEPLKGMRWYGGQNLERTYGITSDKKVQVFIEFKNSKENNPNLGIPLPAGKVRCYKQDPDDKAMEFVGEEKIDHTPKDEKISLQIGNAFDVVGERRQTDFQLQTGRKWMSETFEIKIRNHKAEDITVRIKEPLTRWSQSKITETNVKEFKMLDAFTAAWDVPVKADGETVLTYTVEYQW
ncbi:MAG: DUF4139 domain-containing protein [Planctomycetaceae bacterium]|nr:MAG: DUF4139 domain-containing protein [Planctomycetaceae bacterium]